MIRKAHHKPPTFVPVGSAAGQRELRQCECCGKLQTIGEGFSVAYALCKECNEGFDEPITQSGALIYTWRPVLKGK